MRTARTVARFVSIGVLVYVVIRFGWWLALLDEAQR